MYESDKLIMAQNITLKLAGREYRMSADSQQMESMMRIAAEAINEQLKDLDAKFTKKTLEEKLAIVALNETVKKLRFQNQFEEIEKEVKLTAGQIDNYLENIDKNGR